MRMPLGCSSTKRRMPRTISSIQRRRIACVRRVELAVEREHFAVVATSST
jgi:hypothetical protein